MLLVLIHVPNSKNQFIFLLYFTYRIPILIKITKTGSTLCLLNRDETTHPESVCSRRRDAFTVFSRRRRPERFARSSDMKKGICRASDRETSSRFLTIITSMQNFFLCIPSRRQSDMWMKGDVIDIYLLREWSELYLTVCILHNNWYCYL